ncbi:MAG: outer membrane beta-barrel family protein, partial [Prevotella sp.]|nr:outer membrane beta-barrel family protein [Prevotella sp.]
TNVNAYYYKLDAFNYEVNDQLVEGEAQTRFTWNVRIQASLMLPYGISVQANGRYNSRRAITQGYRPAMCFADLGVRKSFFNKMLVLTVNCRDLFDSRAWKSVTQSDTYWRRQVNRRNSRNVSFTLTWNFGNAKNNKKRGRENNGGDTGEDDNYGSDDV